MGSLRFLFALTVVFAHSYGNMFVGGRNAVQLFYMISGFLISYVIVDRKSYSSVMSFYVNRYLRLYPIYFVVAVLTFIVFSFDFFLMKKEVKFFDIYQNAPLESIFLLVFSNIFLFFQDWFMFIGVEHNKMIFSMSFAKSDVFLYEGLLVPQAWTLGVELSFYLLAPFIVTRKRIIVVLLFLSLIFRAYLIYIGIGRQDPWTYRFFPTELALFLLGVVSHQFVLPFYRNIFLKKKIDKYSVLSTLFLILITLVFSMIPINGVLKSAMLFGVFFLLMPLAFLFQSKRNWDKWMGDLSYPIYICHMLIIYVTESFIVKIDAESSIFIGLFVAIISVILSIVLKIYIGDPVEAVRNKIRANPERMGAPATGFSLNKTEI